MASFYQRASNGRALIANLLDGIISTTGEQRAEALAVDVARIAELPGTDKRQAKQTLQHLASWRALTDEEKAALLNA